jgi:hypothetical protein
MTDNNTKREFLKFHDERGVPDLRKLIAIFGSELPNSGVGLGTMGRSERCLSATTAATPMSGYWTELGPLPDAAFENEPGEPSPPALSAAEFAAFDEVTEALAAAARIMLTPFKYVPL